MTCIRDRWWRWKFRIVLPLVILQMCFPTLVSNSRGEMCCFGSAVLSCQVDCNQVLTAPLGSFTSPCYPGDYPKSLACKWKLQAPAGFIVQLTFVDFELEEALGCIYDRVIVSTGSSDVKFCGITAHGLTLNSTGNVMELSFNADFSIQKKGFNVTYRQVAVALRNQKVKIYERSREVVQASSFVTIPTLQQFTICFEIALNKRPKKREKIFSYVSSEDRDILALGMEDDMTLNINSVECNLKKILEEDDFTSSMKPFCFAWTSISGRVTMYSNGYRTTSCTDSRTEELDGGGTFRFGDGSKSFDGDLYNFRLWDYAMSRTQLTDLTCDMVGNVLDWDNKFWDIPSSHVQTDSSLSCICFPNCTHLTTAVPSSGTAIPTPSSPSSCASSGMGCPAQSTTTSPAITTSMAITSLSTDAQTTSTSLITTNDTPISSTTATAQTTSTSLITTNDTPISSTTATAQTTSTSLITTNDTPISSTTATAQTTSSSLITTNDTPISSTTATAQTTSTSLITTNDTPISSTTAPAQTTSSSLITTNDTPISSTTATAQTTSTSLITTNDTPISSTTAPAQTTSTSLITTNDTPISSTTATAQTTSTSLITTNDTPISSTTATAQTTSTSLITTNDTPISSTTATAQTTSTSLITTNDTPISSATATAQTTSISSTTTTNMPISSTSAPAQTTFTSSTTTTSMSISSTSAAVQKTSASSAITTNMSTSSTTTPAQKASASSPTTKNIQISSSTAPDKKFQQRHQGINYTTHLITPSAAISLNTSLLTSPANPNNMASLRLILQLGEAAADLSTTPHTRPLVIAGPRSSKTSLGMISTPLIWPVRRKPETLTRGPKRPVIYLTKPPAVPPMISVPNTSPQPKVTTSISVSGKADLMSEGDIQSMVAHPWQPAGTQNWSEHVESFQAASHNNRKNKPLAPNWALEVSTENSTINWTESLEYSSGMEPFIYDIGLGEESFSLFDFQLPYSLDESLVDDDAFLANTLNAMSFDDVGLDPEEIEMPLNDLPEAYLGRNPLAGDSVRRPPAPLVPMPAFYGVPNGAGAQTYLPEPNSLGEITLETNADIDQEPSSLDPWLLSTTSIPSVLDDHVGLSNKTEETEMQTDVPLASSFEGQSLVQSTNSSEHLDSFLPAVSEVVSLFPTIRHSELEWTAFSDSAHILPSQADAAHWRSPEEAIVTPAIEMQSDLLMTEALTLPPLSSSHLSDFFLALTRSSAEVRHSSSQKDYRDLPLLSLTEQFTSTARPHFKDSQSTLHFDTMPTAQSSNTAVIMSDTPVGSRLDSSLALELSQVNSSSKTLFSGLKGHYSRPSDSDNRWMHISVSDITEVSHGATAALADKLPSVQPFNAIPETMEGQIDILPTFSIPVSLSQTGFLHNSLFSQLADNSSVDGEEEKSHGMERYLTEGKMDFFHLNDSQWGSLSVTHLLEPSYPDTLGSQAQSTWQGLSQANDNDFTYLSETKSLPSLLNASPTVLNMQHVSFSEHSESFLLQSSATIYMSSLNVTSLRGSSDHAGTQPPHSDEEEFRSVFTPILDLTSFSAKGMMGEASGATQSNQPSVALMPTSGHYGSQQWASHPTGQHKEQSRPTALLETGHGAQIEPPLNGSAEFSDGNLMEAYPNDKIVSASSHLFSTTDSSTGTKTWKTSNVAVTTSNHPEAHLSHLPNTAAIDQTFIPTKGPTLLFTPPRGVSVAMASLPTRTTRNGISSAILELKVCQCKARFHISCLCGLSTGNKALYYRLSFVVNDNQAQMNEMEVEQTVVLWLNQTFQNWTYSMYVANVSIQISDVDEAFDASKRYACLVLLVYRFTSESPLEEAVIKNWLRMKNLTIGSGLELDAIVVQAVENCKAEENPTHYNWPESRPTVTQFVPCFPNKALNASRICVINLLNYSSFWDTPDFTNCTDLDGIEVSAENAAEVVTQLADITQKELSTKDVSKVVIKLKEVVNVAKINASLATTMVTVFSNVMTSSDVALAATSELALKTVDEMVQKIVFDGPSLSISSENLALGISALNTSEYDGTSFSAFLPSNETDVQIDFEAEQQNPLAAVTLPNTLLSNLSDADVELISRLTFMFFSKIGLFQDQTSNGLDLRSYVVASSVGNQTIKNLPDPVRIEIVHLQNQSNPKPVCVFWDFSLQNGTGGWNSVGCRVSPESNEYKTVCLCDHLTHFGILMDISGTAHKIDAENTKILTFITYIGCGISAIFSAATLLTYIAFEKIRRDYPSKILMNLSTSLLLLNMLFLLDGWLASFDMEGLCIAVAAFLHYFLLTSFTWMGLESVHMYIALVKVFNTYIRRYILKFCIVGWGIPAAIISTVVAIDRKFYGKEYYGKEENGQGSSEFCWIRNQLVFYIACVGYFCVIFVLNVAMFIVVMMQICGRNGKRSNRTMREEVLRNLRSMVSLTFLLGMTWGFAFFAWGPVNLAFMYLFAIFNSLQGLFIFIFHCAMKENVQKQWRRYLCCGKFRLAENSDWSKTATNNTKKVSSDNIGKSLSSSSFGSSTANWTSKAKATLNPFAKRSSNTGKGYTSQISPKFSPVDGDASSSIIPVHQVIDKVKGYCSVRSDNFYKNIIMSDSFSHSTKF